MLKKSLIVTLALGLAAARLGAEVKDHPDRRRFQVRRVDAFARWLLSLAGDATPVAPPELVEEYRRVARATAEVYTRDSRLKPRLG